jgi:hypothetical protein
MLRVPVQGLDAMSQPAVTIARNADIRASQEGS